MEKHYGSSLTSWLIVDTLLISKLFSPFLPIWGLVSLGSIFWENLLRTKLTDFSAFPWIITIKKGVYLSQLYSSQIFYYIIMVQKKWHVCFDVKPHINSKWFCSFDFLIFFLISYPPYCGLFCGLQTSLVGPLPPVLMTTICSSLDPVSSLNFSVVSLLHLSCYKRRGNGIEPTQTWIQWIVCITWKNIPKLAIPVIWES